MKSLIVALIMVLPFAGMGQKIQSAVFLSPRNYDRDSTKKGDVKFIRAKGEFLPQINDKELQNKLRFADLLYDTHRDDSIIFNKEGLEVEAYYSMSNPHKNISKHEFKYDSLNNLIEETTTTVDV